MAMLRDLAIAICAMIGLSGFSLASQSVGQASVASPARVLWQIGDVDKSPNGFALAPDKYASYVGDSIFVIGVSKPENDGRLMDPRSRPNIKRSRLNIDPILFGF